jgi:integrase
MVFTISDATWATSRWDAAMTPANSPVTASSTGGVDTACEPNIDAPVFCDQRGGWLRKSNVSRRSFIPAIMAAKVPTIRFHDLRHTHATLLLRDGENVKVVSERLGHSSIEITLKYYSHVMPSMQEGAASRIQALFG